jgi:hypothetical protein
VVGVGDVGEIVAELFSGMLMIEVTELSGGNGDDTVMVERAEETCCVDNVPGEMGTGLIDVFAGGGVVADVGAGADVLLSVVVTTSILQSARIPLPARNIPIMELLATFAF